jgi:hypothetical protein
VSKRQLPLVQERGCGSCTACCTALQVKSLGKGDYEKCKHLRRGSIKGCGIYKDRPKDCSDYECLWLAGIIESHDFRPDKCGFVMNGSASEEIGAYIMVHELRPGASRTLPAVELLEMIAKTAVVIEIQRDGIRKVRGGPAEAVQRIIAVVKEMAEKGVPGYELVKNKPEEER